jgi:hypothetical protein
MPRGIPNIISKSKWFVCMEAFSVTLDDGDHWYKVGQRVHEDNELFKGESGENRRNRLFLPEDEVK